MNSMNLGSHLYDFSQRAFAFVKRERYEEQVESLVAPLGDLSGKTVLEVGAGTCKLSAYIKNRFPEADVYASDISRSHLELGARKAELRTVLSPTEELAGKLDKRFDIIIAFDTLHHHYDMALALENCRSLLKEGGLLLVRDVSRTLPGFWRYAMIDKTDFIIAKMQGAKYRAPSYLSHDEFHALLGMIGFENIEVEELGAEGLVVIRARRRG